MTNNISNEKKLDVFTIEELNAIITSIFKDGKILYHDIMEIAEQEKPHYSNGWYTSKRTTEDGTNIYNYYPYITLTAGGIKKEAETFNMLFFNKEIAKAYFTQQLLAFISNNGFNYTYRIIWRHIPEYIELKYINKEGDTITFYNIYSRLIVY